MQHPTTPHASRHSTAVKATKEEMDKNQVDLALRDACAHLLIPLNKCVNEHECCIWDDRVHACCWDHAGP